MYKLCFKKPEFKCFNWSKFCNKHDTHEVFLKQNSHVAAYYDTMLNRNDVRKVMYRPPAGHPTTPNHHTEQSLPVLNIDPQAKLQMSN